MSLKKFFAAGAVAVLAAVGLSACTSHVGAAAFVGDHRISDKTVGTYATRQGPDIDKISDAGSPRASALGWLIRNQLFTTALARTGGVPSDAQLAAAHDAAISTFTQYDPRTLDSEITKQEGAYGLRGEKYASLVVRSFELEYLYVERSKVTSPAELSQSLIKLDIPVTVAGKYGTWDQAQLTLDNTGTAGKPSFVTFPQSDTSSQAANAQG